MSDQPINLSTHGLPRTVLPPFETAAVEALREAMSAAPAQRRDLVAAIVADHPKFLDGWARLGDLGRDPIERYAAYRVGYHRGLDALRANGWRGSGYVRWADETNRGFLRALRGLGQTAAAIGEQEEAERIALFLAQLDPSGVPASERAGA